MSNVQLLFWPPLILAVPVVAVSSQKSAFRERKTTFKKRERPVKALGRPSTGLYPLLGIYTHGSKKASKLAVFRGVSFRSDRTGQIWTILDNSGQNWTILDRNGHCLESVNFILCWRGAGSTFAHNSRIQDCAIGDNHRQSQLSQMSQLSQFR